jgi:hypothetical protein
MSHAFHIELLNEAKKKNLLNIIFHINSYIEKCEEPTLSTMYKLIEELYANDFHKQRLKMKEFISTTTSPENKRIGMEFYIIQGEAELLESLVEEEQNSAHALNREWANTYEILIMKNKGQLQGDRLNQAVLSMNSTTKEMHLLLCILHMFGIYQIGEYEAFFKVSKAILPEVQQIQEPFIRTSYELHLLELCCFSHLLLNQIEYCRKTAKMVISKIKPYQHPIAASNAYHVLAQSYVFESFEESMRLLDLGYKMIDYLPESKALSKRKEFDKTKEFVRSLWRRELDSTPDDPVERAHRYIVRGEKEKGIYILEEIKLKQGHNLSPFQWYYYGLATGNEEYFHRSRQIFHARKNKFFVKILETL